MSQKGKEKKFQRLVKKANRMLLVPPEQKTPHDLKLWKEGTSRVLHAVAHEGHGGSQE